MWGLAAQTLALYVVNSTADFLRIKNVVDAEVRLGADLDFAGVKDFAPQAFVGVFDGANRTISNLVINQAEVFGGSLFFGLFGRLCGPASVRDLVLRNVTVDARTYARSTNNSVFIGVVAGAGAVSLSNVRVRGARVVFSGVQRTLVASGLVGLVSRVSSSDSYYYS